MRNDVSRKLLRKATRMAGDLARSRAHARDEGGLVYVADGMIVMEKRDGTRETIQRSEAKIVSVTERSWKLVP